MAKHPSLAVSFFALLTFTTFSDGAWAEFATVINSPPDSLGDYRWQLDSDTQLNLYSGALVTNLSVGRSYEPVSNVEVNLLGGRVGSELQLGNWNGTNLNVVANLYDGEVGRWLLIVPGATVNWFGGRIAHEVAALDGSRLNISGNDFRIDGVPVAGSIGQSLPLNIPAEGVFSGTLADGTTFAFSGADAIEVTDYVRNGTLVLHPVSIPSAMPASFHLPGNPVPRGLRAGQSLTVADGGMLGGGFNASWGSVVDITGGTIGESFEAIGSVVNISGGTIGELATAYRGTVINLSGGSIASNFSAATGSTVNMTGGKIGQLFDARAGSVVNLAGGDIAGNFRAREGSNVTIHGGEFRLNGVPITGLGEIGSSRPFDLPANSVLSGTYADGKIFTFSHESWDYFASGSLTLRSTALPEPERAVWVVPGDAAPNGLRMGQTLLLAEGGSLGDGFIAGWGASATITGGQVGHDFEAVGSMVNISGGEFGWRFHSLHGSLVNIGGGTFGGAFNAGRGSVVNIAGGSFERHFHANAGSVLNIVGGTLGDYGSFDIGSVVNLSGGSIGREFRVDGGTLNMSGGAIGEGLQLYSDGTINLAGGVIGDGVGVWNGRAKITGSDFRLDGVPVDVPMNGLPTAFDIPDGSVLSGTLQDGTPVAFSSQDRSSFVVWNEPGDHFEPGTLRLESWGPPAPGPSSIYLPGSPTPTGVRAGQTLFVAAGGTIGDNFAAGWGSIATITGGEIGDNFEAVGSQILITGGTIGEGFDAFFGTQATIRGGTFGDFFDAHRGSVVNIRGGEFGYGFSANSGSEVAISGGILPYGMRAEADSTVKLIGSGFALNGVPIDALLPGKTLEVTARNTWLSGYFADGSEFNFYLHGDDYVFSGYIDPNALLLITSVLSGDYNGDGTVNAADYTVWRNSLGQMGSGLAADGNRDGRVDGSDYEIWQSAHRGLSGAGSLAHEAIPEPTAFVLVIVVGGICVTRRIGRQTN